jgi:hypothetical protein
MSEDIRKMINNVRNWKQSLNENAQEDRVDEGFKNIVATGLIGAASLLPMKSQAQTFQKSDNKPKTEMSIDSSISNDNFLKIVKKYEKQGYEKEAGGSATMFINQNKKPIKTVSVVSQTKTSANASAMQKAGNPAQSFKMYKTLSNNNVELILFYIN